jgi:hypothetical protein
LKLVGPSIEKGLQPGGSRQAICERVNGNRLLQIDGYVQRISGHDLKVVLRGSDGDITVAVAEITSGLTDTVVTFGNRIHYTSRWPDPPTFRILKSSVSSALKSEQSPEHYDKKSVASQSTESPRSSTPSSVSSGRSSSRLSSRSNG